MRGFVTFVHSFVQQSSRQGHLTLLKTSHKTNVVDELPFGAQERNACDSSRGRVTSWDSKGGGFSALPSGADPRTEQAASTLEPAIFIRKVKRFSACPGWPFRFFFLVSVRWFSFPVPVCFCFFFLLLFLATGRGRHVPAPGWEGRRVEGKGTDPRTGFFRYPSTFFHIHFAIYFLRSWFSQA